MAKTLSFGDRLQISAEDFIESATALIAKRGSGKSGGVKVIEEELCKAKLPFVVFDPAGIHWGLRSSFDGKSPSGFEALVIGGEHGDLPLDRKAGRIVARSIATSNVSLIIDFSGTPKVAYREFVADFADELFQTNQLSRLIIIEEAPRIVPQRLFDDGMKVAFAAVEQLVSMGRNKGLGVVLVSQRAATINKDVLTQVDNLIVMGITGPQDRAAVREWVEQNADAHMLKTFLDGLSSLKPREAWLWSPQLSIFSPFRFRDFTTFHPDRTHLRKMGMMTVRAKETDAATLVERLGGEMKVLAEKAKADDPAALRARIRELERQKPAAAEPIIVERVVEVVPRRLLGLVRKAEAAILELKAAADGAQANGHAEPPHPVRAKATTKRPAAKATVAPSGEGPTGPELRILDSLAWLKSIGQSPAEETAVAFLAGYTVGGGAFNNPRGALRTRGLIEYHPGGRISMTTDGEALATSPGDDLTPHEIQGRVLARLPGPEAKILRVLIDAWPNSLTKEDCAAASGYSAGGGAFNNPVGRLRSLGLADYPERGAVRAMPVLFLETAR